MRLYQDLYVHIQPDMTGALKPIVLKAIKQASRDFCKATEAWHSTHTSNSDKAQLTYSFSLANYNAILLRVVSVKINGGYPIDANDYEVLDDQLSIRLKSYPGASVVDGIEIEVAMLPEFTAVELSYPFFDRWCEAITERAKAILFKQPKKPYTDLNQYQICMQDYRRIAGDCKMEKFKKNRAANESINIDIARSDWV